MSAELRNEGAPGDVGSTSASARKSEFQQHIHVFRGVAIILIVCAHTIPSLDWQNNPTLERALDAIANQSSILFFFIAGYLFQHLSGRFEFPKYLKQKLKTVILPYLLLSIPALFIFTVLTRRTGMFSGFYDLAIWQQVLLFLITGKHLAPLWFVPTITLFYLAAPLLLALDRRWPTGYWLIVPLLALSTVIGRGGQFGPLNFAVYLLPAYLLGMLCSRYRDTALELTRRYGWALWLVVLGAMAAVVMEWPQPPYMHMPMKAALALLITAWLHRHHGIFGSRLNYIAEVSFGIFFIHAYFISAVKVATVFRLSGAVYDGRGGDVIPGNLLVFALYVGFVLACTVGVLWFAKKLLGSRSRMFVGA